MPQFMQVLKPHIAATLYVLIPEEVGHVEQIFVGCPIRFHHEYTPNDDCIWIISINADKCIGGQTYEIELSFQSPELQQGRLWEGLHFRLQFDSRIIARGVITKLYVEEMRTEWMYPSTTFMELRKANIVPLFETNSLQEQKRWEEKVVSLVNKHSKNNKTTVLVQPPTHQDYMIEVEGELETKNISDTLNFMLRQLTYSLNLGTTKHRWRWVQGTENPPIWAIEFCTWSDKEYLSVRILLQLKQFTPHIAASLYALTPEEGGHDYPLFTGVLPIFHHDYSYYVCGAYVPFILNEDVSGQGEIRRGEITEVGILFNNPNNQYGRLWEGLHFRLQFGGRVIARGVITKLYVEEMRTQWMYPSTTFMELRKANIVPLFDTNSLQEQRKWAKKIISIVNKFVENRKATMAVQPPTYKDYMIQIEGEWLVRYCPDILNLIIADLIELFNLGTTKHRWRWVQGTENPLIWAIEFCTWSEKEYLSVKILLRWVEGK